MLFLLYKNQRNKKSERFLKKPFAFFKNPKNPIMIVKIKIIMKIIIIMILILIVTMRRLSAATDYAAIPCAHY